MSADAGHAGINARTHVYVWLVALAALASLVAAAVVGPRPQVVPLVALIAFSVLIWSVGENLVESQLGISLQGILLLTSAVILGPLGAGLIGLLVAGVSRGRTPWPARVFNMGVLGLLGVVAGATYAVAGGTMAVQELHGLGPVARDLGLPLLVADAAQAVVNVLLIAGIMRLSQEVPVRLTLARLLLTTGALSVGYGVLAILLVLLWLPAGLGPLSILLLLAPLVGAQWALAQYAAQKRTQDQSLDLLVAAIELRLPHLAGHAARVGELAGRMAEHLGLGPSEVWAIRGAGLLHDLGQVALPPELLEMQRGTQRPVHSPHPRRGAQMLHGVAFLHGVVEIFRADEILDGTRPLGADIVALAAAYDMAVQVEGRELSVESFCAQWPRAEHLPRRVIDALQWGVARAPSGAPR